MATVVLGSQWGDEGKGKLVDVLCEDIDVCARCAGGNNAGHTIIANGISYDFHILPSGQFLLLPAVAREPARLVSRTSASSAGSQLGFFCVTWRNYGLLIGSNKIGLVNPKCLNLIGTGTVVHVPSFFAELKAIQDKGLDSTDRIFISDRAHLVFDLHQLVDGLEEVELGAKNIGTTRKGIGPTYSTKASRSGIRVHELFDWPVFERKLRLLADGYKKRFGALLGDYSVDKELEQYKVYTETLRPYVVDAVPFMQSAVASKKKILVEGANALMLDIDYGTYPYVTSSNTGIGGVITGLAISPFNIKNIIGVVKAYTTRVGSGPFPTEQLNVCSPSLSLSACLTSSRSKVSTFSPLDVSGVLPLDASAVVDGSTWFSSSTLPPSTTTPH
jgi:adenylosuccinate synthase